LEQSIFTAKGFFNYYDTKIELKASKIIFRVIPIHPAERVNPMCRQHFSTGPASKVLLNSSCNYERTSGIFRSLNYQQNSLSLMSDIMDVQAGLFYINGCQTQSSSVPANCTLRRNPKNTFKVKM
jgi:hypothetical protein